MGDVDILLLLKMEDAIAVIRLHLQAAAWDLASRPTAHGFEFHAALDRRNGGKLDLREFLQFLFSFFRFH